MCQQTVNSRDASGPTLFFLPRTYLSTLTTSVLDFTIRYWRSTKGFSLSGVGAVVGGRKVRVDWSRVPSYSTHSNLSHIPVDLRQTTTLPASHSNNCTALSHSPLVNTHPNTVSSCCDSSHKISPALHDFKGRHQHTTTDSTIHDFRQQPDRLSWMIVAKSTWLEFSQPIADETWHIISDIISRTRFSHTSS